MTPFTTAIIERLKLGIKPVSPTWQTTARQHLDTLTKPLGSLGRLEDLATQLVTIYEGSFTLSLAKGVYIFAADHGITAEGVSAYPREVTYQMVLNFLSGGAAINVLARLHNVALQIIDVGVEADFAAASSLLQRKVARGTANMLHEAAMTDEQLAQGLTVGAEMAASAAAAGQTLIAIGEMGIGNTTAASVITCALTGSAPALATGLGTGINSVAHAHKIRIIEQVLQKHSTAVSPIDILRCTGGLEIAAMTGMILAAAQKKLAIVIDGFISTAAAALAVAIEPNIHGYLIAGHRSEEPGHTLLLDHLHLTPVLTLGMRLGEGTGAVLAMPILESALSLYAEMATFASASVSKAAE
jgi:nicotinate-nucleotide--dimethylbenzimidazole phosphoribosyltransferase